MIRLLPVLTALLLAVATTASSDAVAATRGAPSRRAPHHEVKRGRGQDDGAGHVRHGQGRDDRQADDRGGRGADRGKKKGKGGGRDDGGRKGSHHGPNHK